MIFSVYSLALVISGGAIPTSMAISIARMRAKEKGDIKVVIVKYSIIASLFGIAFFLFFFFGAPLIANLQGNSLASYGYRYISFAILFSSLISIFRGVFQGYENMTPTAVSQVIEQGIKLIIGLSLAYLFRDAEISQAVVGAILGVTISELLSLIYLFFRFILFSSKIKNYTKSVPIISKDYMPIFLYVLVIPLVTAIDSFLFVNLMKFDNATSTALFGIQSGMVNSLINFPVIFSVALSTSLIPSLTYSISKDKKSIVNGKVKESIGLVWMLILPFVLAFFILAPTIMDVAYSSLPSELKTTSITLLQCSSFQMLFIALLQVSSGVLQAFKRTKFLILNLFVCAVIKISLTALLVSTTIFNIYGLVISNIMFYLLASIFNLAYLKHEFKIKLEYKKIVIPLILISFLFLPCAIIQKLSINLFLKLFILSVLGIILYIFPIIYFKILKLNAFKTKEIED